MSIYFQLALALFFISNPTQAAPTNFLDTPSEAWKLARSGIIFPGTKWCGPGNIAPNYDDLGSLEDTDKCCRAHDHCDNIAAGKSRDGLRNDTPYTKMHCDCDVEFLECLKSASEPESDLVGELYFMANKVCFKDSHPIVECTDYEDHLWIHRCSNYTLDTTKPKRLQYFDLPFYL